MTWVKLDDVMPEHPKVVGLKDRAFRAHIEALCYSARTRTCGAISFAAAQRNGWTRSAGELVDARLWELGDDGWRIHDFEQYNPLRDEQARHEGKVAGGKARASQAARDGGRFTSSTSRQPADNQQPATSSDQPRPDPVPIPIPNPTDSAPKTRATRAVVTPFTDADRDRMRLRYGAVATVTEIDEQIELSLAHKAAKNTNRLDLYVNNWLRRSFEGRDGNNRGSGSGGVRGAGSHGFAPRGGGVRGGGPLGGPPPRVAGFDATGIRTIGAHDGDAAEVRVVG